MTREEAIEIIRKEYLCVDRECDIERSCGKCPYMMPTKEPILEAYKMAIQALSQESEIEENIIKYMKKYPNHVGNTDFWEGFYACRNVVLQLDDEEYAPKEKEPCDDAISLTKEAYSDLCLRASKADNLQRALDMEKGAYNALVKNIQCDDAVSREDALKLIYDFKEKHTEDREKHPINYGTLLDLIRLINELPSVTPKQRTGHWIETADEYYKAVNEYGGGVNEDTPYFVDDIACSVCLAMFSTIDNETERFDYCPNCGAKMVEPQESEDKE